LTESADDVLSQLGPLVGRAAAPATLSAGMVPGPAWPLARAGEAVSDDGAIELIVARLGPIPVAVDELLRQCHLSAATMATLLLELELAGRVERHPGNLVSLR
jgi:DNA processing protein